MLGEPWHGDEGLSPGVGGLEQGVETLERSVHLERSKGSRGVAHLWKNFRGGGLLGVAGAQRFRGGGGLGFCFGEG